MYYVHISTNTDILPLLRRSQCSILRFKIFLLPSTWIFQMCYFSFSSSPNFLIYICADFKACASAGFQILWFLVERSLNTVLSFSQLLVVTMVLRFSASLMLVKIFSPGILTKEEKLSIQRTLFSFLKSLLTTKTPLLYSSWFLIIFNTVFL